MTQSSTLRTLGKTSASNTTAPKVFVIEPTKPLFTGEMPNFSGKRRVAAYARVSTEQDEQQSSYEAHLRYYATYIHSNPDWEFVKVYADDGISGTSRKHRDEFNQMVADAKAGKIDLILTKSISRFARNTVDALTVTRELKSCGVEVQFEKENLSSFDASAEIVFTMFSSIAQEESRSISENVRWGHQRRMEQGKTQLAFSRFLGYDKGKNGEWVINEKEAKVVREIYDQFLSGKTIGSIANRLTKKGIKTPGGKEVWGTQTVNSILQNEKYKGDAKMQKTYTADFLSKEVKKNTGEKRQYYVKGHHPAIIEPDVFDLVQVELERRSKLRLQISNNSPFTTKIICGDCGSSYGHKVHHGRDVWYCNHKYKNERKCQSPMFHQEELESLFCQALGQELALVAAGKGHRTLSPDVEAKLAQKLLKSRDKAEETLKVEMEDFRQRQSYLPEEESDAGIEHLTDLKNRLRVANEAVVANAARREKQKRFTKATDGLTPDSVSYSDDLFTMSVELVNVKKVGTNDWSEGCLLEFQFTNGQTVEVRR